MILWTPFERGVPYKKRIAHSGVETTVYLHIFLNIYVTIISVMMIVERFPFVATFK